MDFTPNTDKNEKMVRLVIGGVLVAIAAFTNMLWVALIGLVLVAAGLTGYCPAKCLMKRMGCHKKEGACGTGMAACSTEGACSTEAKPADEMKDEKKEGCCGGGCH
jgi:hypothetical protein